MNLCPNSNFANLRLAENSDGTDCMIWQWFRHRIENPWVFDDLCDTVRKYYEESASPIETNQ